MLLNLSISFFQYIQKRWATAAKLKSVIIYFIFCTLYFLSFLYTSQLRSFKMASWSHFCLNSDESHIKSSLSYLSYHTINPVYNYIETINYTEIINLTNNKPGALFIQTQYLKKIYSWKPQISTVEHLHQTSLK